MAKKSNSRISLKSSLITEFLTHIINNNREIQSRGLVPVSVEVVGEAGLGKTTVIKDLAKNLGLNFVKLNLAQIEELGDIIGFPIRQFQMCQTKLETVDGQQVRVKDEEVCLWVDEHTIASYEKEGYVFTGQNRMSYCPPEWIADKTDGGILLLDDYTRADPRFMQATMELVSQQEYISWKLPKDWHIILSSNPNNGEYLVTEMDVAQQTRYISIDMKFDVKDWAKWAEEEGIDGRCINFMLMHGRDFIERENSKVNPRSMVLFFNSISSIKDFNANLPLVTMIGEGSVGQEVANLFGIFINNKLDKLISPEDMMGGNEKDVLKEILSIVGSHKDNSYKAAIASVLTTRLINYSVYHAKDNKINQSYIDRLVALVEHEVFGKDLSFNLVKQIYASNPKYKLLAQSNKVAKIVVG